MAITTSISEIWAKAILANLQNTLVFGQASVVTKEYEGEIKAAGDVVHVTSIVDPAVRAYTGADITWDDVTDADHPIAIDQAQYFAFKAKDLNKVQSAVDYVTAATLGAAYNLQVTADAYIAIQMAAGVHAGNALGAKTIATPDDAWKLLVDLRGRLSAAGVPIQGRWVAIPTDLYGVLLQDDRFVKVGDSGTSEGLRNGLVGRAAGFEVLETQSLPGGNTVLAGYPGAFAYAEQILETESIRLPNDFADGVRGLHVYGGDVLRPTGLASAIVTISQA